MTGYLVKRILLAAGTLLGALVGIFLVVRLVPGDPALTLLGDSYSPEAYAALRAALGLDKSLPLQFAQYFSSVLTGNFGTSFRTSAPVMQVLLQQFPWTALLAIAALAIAVLVGVPAGVVSALRRNSWVNQSLMLLSLVGICTPSFVLGILLMLVFSLHLGWFPAVGGGMFTQPFSIAVTLVLPALTLGFASAALIARLSRAALLDVLSQDYVRTARAKGLSNRSVVYRHALRNALIPILTIIGIDLGRLLAGTTVVEIVFSRPGIGHLLIDAVKVRDYPQIQGTIFFYIGVTILVNTLVDITYATVDPRIRYA